MTSRRLRLGTRASPLARWQANWVAAQLSARGVDVELVPITTRGDVRQRGPIDEVGSPGVFTKELQRALLDGHADLAVHSLKDLPTDAVDGLVLSAIPERESAYDVLVCRTGKNLEDLPAGAVIGTGSLRRRAQLLYFRPDFEMHDIRGNVDTRLEKLAVGQFNALVLAHAGLKRLGREDQIAQVLPFEIMLPAIGQGALAIEARRDDRATLAALEELDHPPTHQAVLAERTLLATLLGGCLAPVGGLARIEADGGLHLQAVVLSPDGKVRIAARGIAGPGEALKLGADVAGQLIAQGASELIRQSRQVG